MNKMIFVCLVPALLASLAASVEMLDNNIVDENVTCLETETQCESGCCPYANATCCSETQTCCRQGSVCLGSLDVCIGVRPGVGEGSRSNPHLYSEKPSALKVVRQCPPNWTPCYGGCCPFVRGVCCPDKTTCCPYGFYCSGAVCRKNSASLEFLSTVLSKPPANSLPAEKQPILKTYPAYLKEDIVDKDVTCLETETQCGSGCCPYANATCCSETQTCCRQGSVCLGALSVCIGVRPGAAEDSRSTLDLYSEKPSALRAVSQCPPDWTPCYGGCCPFVSGVCCPDRTTCCPYGFYCSGTVCRKNSASLKFLSAVLSKPSGKKQSMMKTYPTPLKEGGPCCLTAFGYKCCPDFWICTYTGCQGVSET